VVCAGKNARFWNAAACRADLVGGEITMRGFGVLALAVALAGGIGSAHAALTFDFSFGNTTGNVAGTVTGDILGLANNSVRVVRESTPILRSQSVRPWAMASHDAGPGMT
jgi:hypothetical protein